MGYMFLARYNAVTWMNAEEGEGRGGRGEGRGGGGGGKGVGRGGEGEGEGGGERRDVASHRWFSSSRFSRLRRYTIHRDIWSWSRSSKFLSFFGI